MGQAFLKLLLESKECIMALLTMLGIEDKTDNKKKSVKTRAKKTVAKIGALVLGSAEKTVLDCELIPRREARRSLVLTRDMKEGLFHWS